MRFMYVAYVAIKGIIIHSTLKKQVKKLHMVENMHMQKAPVNTKPFHSLNLKTMEMHSLCSPSKGVLLKSQMHSFTLDPIDSFISLETLYGGEYV